MSKKEKENLWQKILTEAVQKDGKYGPKNLLILGNPSSGKRTLTNSLLDVSQTRIPLKKNEQQNAKLGLKDSKSVLDFIYLNVQDLDDPDNDIRQKIRIFVLEDHEQIELLNIVLDQQFIQNMILIINLDFEEPHFLLQSLSQWIDAFTRQLANTSLELEVQDQIRQKLEKYVANFKEPTLNDMGEIMQINRQIDVHYIVLYLDTHYQSLLLSQETTTQDMKLQTGVLVMNYGIPIVVAVNKSDLIEESLKEKDGEMKLDYILYSLRNFTITYGASLFYLSSKTKSNIQQLYEYLLHRFYGFQLKLKSELLSKEQIFIPSGFDSPNIISSIYSQNYQTLVYEDMIKAPQEILKKNIQKEELVVVDNQTFFQQLKEKYEQDGKVKQDNGYFNMLNQDKKGVDTMRIRQNAEQEILSKVGSKTTTRTDKKINSQEAERILQILKNPNRDNK